MRTGILRACAGLAGLAIVLLFASCLVDPDRSPTAPGGADPAASPTLVPASDDDTRPIQVTNIRVQRVSGQRDYEAVEGALADDSLVYIDRLYTYRNVPQSLVGHTYIMTANGDQTSSGNPEFLTFDIDRPAIVYVAYHGQDPPAWVRDGFTPTGQTLIVRKHGPTMGFHLFARSYPAGEVVLGSNRDGESGAAMYTVILKPAPSAEQPPVHVTDIEVASGRVYEAVFGGLRDGALVYMDRDYTYDEVLPLVRGHTYIRTRSGDQAFPPQSDFLRFTIDRPARVYVAYHSAAPPPAWVQSQFTSLGQRVIVQRHAQRLRFYLWARDYAAGEVVLGSNRQGGGPAAMYTVIVVPSDGSAGPFRTVAGGFLHSCGLTSDSRAFCWGDNSDRGQLGNGSWTGSTVPVAVAGGHTFRAISAGGFHSCGVTTDGVGLCWGKNTYGQLGNGDNTDTNVPVPVVGGHTFEWIGAGGYGSCGLTTDGEALCWGRNNYGQLGIGAGTGFTTNTPRRVSGDLAFTELSVGFEHVCGIVGGQHAYCWGKNTLGQLGDGTNHHRNVPRAVVGGHLFHTVSVTGTGTGPADGGQNHSCALDLEGVAWCWGDNWHNNLGTNLGRGHRTTPQLVAGVPTFRSIVTGGDHSCGVTAEGEAWCWGDNKWGQLGSGPPLATYNPAVRVAGGHLFDTIAAGWDHTCAVTTAGFPFCWARNDKGQVGDGTLMNRHRPVAVRLP